jgi:class 3 adenylate cyclase
LFLVNITIEELARLASESFRRAHRVATSINLSTTTKSFSDAGTHKYARNIEEQTISDVPAFADLDHFEGIKAWGAMMSFDLRRSSLLPKEVGARNTYVLMHTFLPTMLQIVRAAHGKVVGLRGDGAIVMFGEVIYPNEQPVNVKPKQAEAAVTAACDCGAAMVKVIDDVVNPILVGNKVVSKPIQIGVGIDVGEFVATNIGLGTAHELTAYGDCVNTACKRSGIGHNQVVLTNDAKEMFPKSDTGRTGFRRYPGEVDAYVLRYPDAYDPMKK